MFTSLKGGVGKTTAASALGFSLAFFSARVLCVDLDFGVRGLDLALGAQDTCGADVLEVIERDLDPSEEAICLSENLYFLPAPALFDTRAESGVSAVELNRFLSRCKQEFDFTLLDLPAGGGELFLPLASSPELDGALVVSTAEGAALRAAEQTAYEIRAAGSAHVRLILNRVPLKKGGSGLFEMVQTASVPVLGVVPEDGFVKEASGALVPLTRLPQSKASQAYWNVASRLLGASVPLFDRVLSRGARKQLY